MITKKSIPLDQFTVPIPNPANRLNTTCVVIYQDGRFNMNGRLAESLGGKKLGVAFTPDAKHFAIRDSGLENPIPFPKSGSKRLEYAASHLKQQGIMFPAKFEVWQNEEGGFWQGDILPNPTQSPSKRRRGSVRKS